MQGRNGAPIGVTIGAMIGAPIGATLVLVHFPGENTHFMFS